MTPPPRASRHIYIYIYICLPPAYLLFSFSTSFRISLRILPSITQEWYISVPILLPVHQYLILSCLPSRSAFHSLSQSPAWPKKSDTLPEMGSPPMVVSLQVDFSLRSRLDCLLLILAITLFHLHTLHRTHLLFQRCIQNLLSRLLQQLQSHGPHLLEIGTHQDSTLMAASCKETVGP